MSAALYYSTNLMILTCGECGIPHAISQTLYDKAMHNNKSWHCPNGHSLIFLDNESTKLKKQLEAKEHQLEWARKDAELARKSRDRHSRRANAFKGKCTILKKRIGNGICPCCNRTFQNLMSHMKLKHPKFKGKT